ncbi:Glycosyl transferase [Marinobacter salarius]|uniref:glycosyltransferase family 2 protein n=1 Tax=Marinobacter salarius TaxID=1420917 RepID=UPI00125A9347|nr:glycosyltransferase [Marinobacter salarius]VVT06226.1 Glycosyl transferase [Marinobacter salarius]VXC07620.1 Glycosyl transferase [Marinobacter salarius]
MDKRIDVSKDMCNIKNQSWTKGTVPLVTISCTTYNQQRYIEKCIEGFLMQETNFPVEILIHDDASTDTTPEIIREYQARYPDLINVILQEENQFSKGKMVNSFNFEKARGKYVALCHGDDYWIDKGKLQKQVSIMEQYGVAMCGHPAREIDVEDNDLNCLTGFKVNSVSLFNSKTLINNNGNMLPFGSIMITKEAKELMLKYMPPVMFHTGIQLLGASKNGLAILPDAMTAYRISVPGSTTEIMLGDNDRRLETAVKRVKSIKTLKHIYSDNESFEFNKLLSKQIKTSVYLKSKVNAFRLVKCMMQGESLPTKFLIVSLSSFYFAKAIISTFR